MKQVVYDNNLMKHVYNTTRQIFNLYQDLWNKPFGLQNCKKIAEEGKKRMFGKKRPGVVHMIHSIVVIDNLFHFTRLNYPLFISIQTKLLIVINDNFYHYGKYSLNKQPTRIKVESQPPYSWSNFESKQAKHMSYFGVTSPG